MALIESYAVFSTPEKICLRDLLNPSMRPHNFHKVSIPFTDGEVKEPGKKTLNSLNFVKETKKICKGERVKYPKKHPINE